MTSPNDIIELLDDVLDDELPKHVRVRVEEMKFVLGEEIDLSLRVDRCRGILEDLDADSQLPAHVRAQLWNLSAAIEML